MEPLPRTLLWLGGALLVLGLWLQYGPSLPWLERLPGDIRIERPGFRLDFPIVTCLIISAVASALWWFLSRFR